jgi:hypothetical protein
VEAISRERRLEHRAHRAALFQRAIERGELPTGTNIELLIDLTFSPIASCMLRHDMIVDEAYMEALVDFVVEGARAGHAVPAKPRPDKV